MRLALSDYLRFLALLALCGLAPLRAREPVQAVLAIDLAPATHSGMLDDDPDPEASQEDPFLLVNHCTHYPFHLRMDNHQGTEEDLSGSFHAMRFPAPVQWTIEYLDRGRPVQRRRVGFGSPVKDANLLKVLMRHQACKDHEARQEQSWIRQMLTRPFAHSEAALAVARGFCARLNCYTFNHFVHFTDTMGFWPFFDRAKWREIPWEALAFGDLVRLANDNALAGDHFLMSLGDGKFLAKLGNTDDFLVTDLEQAARLYRITLEDQVDVVAYRAR
ncbi:MAG: hypothetical protein P4L36_21635 [Holophaga sp.]|nr:hypothetical protein [Holophaga sp.]